MPIPYGNNLKEIAINNQRHKLDADKINIGNNIENFVTGHELIENIQNDIIEIQLIPEEEGSTTGTFSGATEAEILEASSKNKKIIANWPGNDEIPSVKFELIGGTTENDSGLFRAYGTVTAPLTADNSYFTVILACYLRLNLNSHQESLFSVNQIMTSNTYIEITYEGLINLINNDNLTPGARYRIIDYVTKINGTYNIKTELGVQQDAYLHYARSVEHPFDLIVTAITNNLISENASACLHDGDEYFANSKLSAWNIKYTPFNDSSKYSWADEENGKGVIYYMKDEFNNEVGYDFKNIQFLAYGLEAGSDTLPDVDHSLAYEPENDYFHRNGSVAVLFDYLMNHGCPWTFNNLEIYNFFAGSDIQAVITYPTVNDEYLERFCADWYYTWDFYIESEQNSFEHLDFSLNNISGQPMLMIYNNIIKTNIDFLAKYNNFDYGMPLGLNGNIWQSIASEADSTKEAMINNCIFENNVEFNILSTGCFNIYMGSDSSRNIFGVACNNNTIKGKCIMNMLGHYSQNNSLYSNEYIYLSNNCLGNIFGMNAAYIYIGPNVYNCTFGNVIRYINLYNNTHGDFVAQKHICDSVQGTKEEILTISITEATPDNNSPETYYGYDSNGVFKSWNPADSGGGGLPQVLHGEIYEESEIVC